jgi:hypothetical protein
MATELQARALRSTEQISVITDYKSATYQFLTIWSGTQIVYRACGVTYESSLLSCAVFSGPILDR